MYLANWLTILRIVLIPFFVGALIYQRLDWALGYFLLAAITDALDGFVARRTRVTALGSFLDPIADKLLLVSAFVLLPTINGIPVWVAVVVVSRDVIISLGCLIIYLTWGSVNIRVRSLGKLATLIQSICVAGVLLGELMGGFGTVMLYFAYLVAAITAAAGLDYIIIGIRQANEFSASGRE